MRKGSSLKLAVSEGFDRAFSAILDANITTAIVCLILMYFGTGPIRGFAVTLFLRYYHFCVYGYFCLTHSFKLFDLAF